MKIHNHKRKAFSMITAIFVIILMSSVAVFITNISGKMVKATTTQFQREQAALLAKSYTEYAIMAVTANEQNSTNCLNTIQGSYGDYSIVTTIYYIGTNTAIDTSCGNILDNTVITNDTPLNIIVDVNITYPDYDHPDDLNMTYYKRSLQKI